MKYTVIIRHNFDADTRVTMFDNYEKAKAQLHWIWERYYNEEISAESKLNEADCWHEDELSKVTWKDGCYTYFEIVSLYETPEMEGVIFLTNIRKIVREFLSSVLERVIPQMAVTMI